MHIITQSNQIQQVCTIHTTSGGIDDNPILRTALSIIHVVKAIFVGSLCAIFDQGAYFQKEMSLAMHYVTTVSSHTQNVLKGSGNIVEQVRDLKAGFITKLNISGPVDVVLNRSAKSSLIITADDNIIDHVLTKTSGKELSVCLDPTQSVIIANKIQVAVNLPNFPNIDSCGSGSVKSSDKWTVEDLTIELSGSGGVQLASLTGKQLTTSILGSGNLHLQQGNVQKHDLEILGSGNCVAPNLLSNNAKIEINGSGNAVVHVDNKMDVQINGSGSVSYKGTPSLSLDINGSGRIHPL